MSTSKNILAKATLEEEIPTSFAIYDLARFLGVLSMFPDPELTIHEDRMLITEGISQASYTFADPSMVLDTPDKDVEYGDPYVTFSLANSELNQIMKACGVMKLGQVGIVGEEGQLIVRALDVSNPSSDTYDLGLGETDKEFRAIFESGNLKFLPLKYKVHLSNRGISHFIGGSEKRPHEGIEYWVAMEDKNSYFN